MKKVAIWLAIVGVLGIVGVAIFLRSGGPAKASTIAPGDSSVFLNIPNIPLSGFRWTSSSLARIAAEPEVRAFLEKPLAKFGGDPSAKDATGQLTAVKPGNIFASVSPGTNGPSVLIGFQFWGTKKDYDNAVARLREALPPVTFGPTTETHSHLEILSTTHGALEMHSAAVGRWGLVSNSADALKAAMDRALGKSPGTGLDSNPSFSKTFSELPHSPDLLLFLQPAEASNALSAAPLPAASHAIASQMGAMNKAQAIGAVMKMDGDLQTDAVFILSPGNEPSTQQPSSGSIRFTRPDTFFYARDFSFGFGSLPDHLRDLSQLHPLIPAELAQIAEALSDSCGPEVAVIANWNEGALAPSPLAAIQTQDPSASKSALASLPGIIPGAELKESDGLQIVTLPTQFTRISLAQSDDYILAAADSEKLRSTAQSKSDSDTLENSPNFKTALPAFRRANGAFCYIDTRAAFERLHAGFVPVLRFTAAMVPSIGENIDTDKIPPASVISKHLPPIVLSQQNMADGVLIESSGPLSMGQLLLLGTAGAFASNPDLLKTLLEP